jgi:hypothetical protein
MDLQLTGRAPRLQRGGSGSIPPRSTSSPAAAGTHRVLTNTVSSLVVPQSERERAMGSRVTDRIQTVGIPDQQPFLTGSSFKGRMSLWQSDDQGSTPCGSTTSLRVRLEVDPARPHKPCRGVRYPHPRFFVGLSSNDRTSASHAGNGSSNLPESTRSPSSSGQDIRLSIGKRGFDSRWGRHHIHHA